MVANMASRSVIKDYIVQCIVNICNTKTMKIKSGWAIIIQIFKLTAQDSEKSNVEMSFKALNTAVSKHFELLKGNFISLINCLSSYSTKH